MQYTVLGWKYQHDWLYLQSINSDKHLPQSLFAGKFFKMTTFLLWCLYSSLVLAPGAIVLIHDKKLRLISFYPQRERMGWCKNPVFRICIRTDPQRNDIPPITPIRIPEPLEMKWTTLLPSTFSFKSDFVSTFPKCCWRFNHWKYFTFSFNTDCVEIGKTRILF